jgi:hypothetical protein
MLVKNEADIVAYTLRDALRWADQVFVLDNGSTDGTWEIVQSLGGDRVVPWKQDFRAFSNALRGEVFNAFRHVAEEGDWWCKMDADEFYVDDPRVFLDSVPKKYHVVKKRSIDYRIAIEDVAEYKFTGDFAHDREFIRYFEPRAHSETRFFRYRKRLHWEAAGVVPDYIGIYSPVPITVRHYQWRSPEQMQRRLDVRNAIPRDKRGKPFKHVTQAHWRDVLVPRAQLRKDDGTVDLKTTPICNEKTLPRFSYLKKRILHGVGYYP